MEEKKKKYLHEALDNIPRWKKCLYIVLFSVIIGFLSYFAIWEEGYKEDHIFLEATYDDVVLAVQDVQQNGIKANFEDVKGILELKKYEKLSDEYVYTYRYSHFDTIIIGSFNLYIHIKTDGELRTTSPDISTKENFVHHAKDIRKALTFVSILVFWVIIYVIYIIWRDIFVLIKL